MKKNTIILLLSVILVCLSVVAGTYAVVIDVVKEDEENKIVNNIIVRDLFTNTNGEYNELYYDVKRELNITDEEANILIDSTYINDSFQIVLQSIVDYKIDKDISARLTNDKIYNLIEESINKIENISSETKHKIINKSLSYKSTISNYLYDIDVNILNG